MIELSYDTLAYFSKSWGLFYLMGFSIAVLIYAFRPSKKKVFDRRLGKAAIELNLFISGTDLEAVFCHDSVFDKLEALRGVATDEFLEVRRSKLDDPNFWDRHTDRAHRITELSDEIRTLIRSRIRVAHVID